MSIQEIKNNSVNRTGTNSCEGGAPGIHRVTDPDSAGRHQATSKKKEKIKLENALNKIAIECWIRSEPSKKNKDKKENMG